MSNDVNITPPWFTYQKELKEFFAYDPEVEVGELVEDETTNGYYITINARTAKKALALRDVLRKNMCLGNVVVTINVTSDEVDDIIATAFEGNGIIRKITTEGIPGGMARYIQLEPEIVQFFNDDISSPAGRSTFLAESIAKDILDVFPYHAFICTVDIKANGEA